MPNAQDFKIASQALNSADVLVRLRGGDSQQVIIREVKTRHITAAIAEEAELQLSENGARPELLQELKDAKNVLTETQKQAYSQLMVQRQSSRRQNLAPPRVKAEATPGKITVVAAPSYMVAPRHAGATRELNMTTHGWHYDRKGHKVPNAETW